jgi:hypothetical protein
LVLLVSEQKRMWILLGLFCYFLVSLDRVGKQKNLRGLGIFDIDFIGLVD